MKIKRIFSAILFQQNVGKNVQPLEERNLWKFGVECRLCVVVYVDVALFGGAFAPITVGVEFEDGGVVDESVDHGDGHAGIGEDAIPGREGMVAGDDDAAAFIAVGDAFKEDGRFVAIPFDIADVIEAEDLIAVETLEGGGQAMFGGGGLEFLDEVGGSIVFGAAAVQNVGVHDGGCEVRFTGP